MMLWGSFPVLWEKFSAGTTYTDSDGPTLLPLDLVGKFPVLVRKMQWGKKLGKSY